MGKAVLVINMPKSCYGCRFYAVDDSFSIEKTNVCNAFCDVIREEEMKSKPKWCPLKPIPKQNTFTYESNDYQKGYVIGYNTCLDKIIGEEQ